MDLELDPVRLVSERYELLPSIQKQQDFLSFQLDCIEDINERLKTHYEQQQDDTELCARQILPTLATATKFLGDSLEEMASTPVYEFLHFQEGRYEKYEKYEKVEWNGRGWSGMEWSGVEWSGVEWNGQCLKSGGFRRFIHRVLIAVDGAAFDRARESDRFFSTGNR